MGQQFIIVVLLIFVGTCCCQDAVRLVGGNGNKEGRVEVFIAGEWGTICDDLWDINDGHVICRQLGYSGADTIRNFAYFGEGSGRIWLDNVECAGDEETIADCRRNQFGDHNCQHYEDAGVECSMQEEEHAREAPLTTSSTAAPTTNMKSIISTMGTPASQYRDDRRCGGNFIAPNGEVAICDPNSQYPCCSYDNWCGSSSDHCECGGCNDYRITGSEYRPDRRCGSTFYAPNGNVAKCDPNGLYPCCSNYHWCGSSTDHCECGGCLDYRIQGSEYRTDRRCGSTFYAPNGNVAKCDPNGRYPCCSNNHWCGSSTNHCKCGGCLDYRIQGSAYRIDRRCGGNHIAPNGNIARCDPNFYYPCCSNYQWCGRSSAHCYCSGCIDYRYWVPLTAPPTNVKSNISTMGTPASQYRHDRRCGGNFIAPNGEVAICDPNSQYPCCSYDNWCGNSSDHCECGGCNDYRITGSEYRTDRRCGSTFYAPNGNVAKCDPNGRYPCCSNYHWCGSSTNHCECGGCLDYRIQGSAYRIDRRCGGHHIAPNGNIARCDPDGRYPCCSNYQWCGSSSAHCDCSGCIDYRYWAPLTTSSTAATTNVKSVISTMSTPVIEDIRLVNGYSHNTGRVEVYVNGEWGTVCHDRWEREDAEVVCRWLGYTGADAALGNAFFGEGTGPIWLDNVRCSGDEETLRECRMRPIGEHNCGHDEDAGVECTIAPTLFGPRPGNDYREDLRCRGGYSAPNFGQARCNRNGAYPCCSPELWCGNTPEHCECEGCVDYRDSSVRDIRLRGPYPHAGKVEVFIFGEWGSVCNDYWDIEDANVACRMLGYTGADEIKRGDYYGEGYDPVLMDDVHCKGDEESLSDCPRNEPGYHDCDHRYEAASAVCTLPSSTTLSSPTTGGGGTEQPSTSSTCETLRSSLCQGMPYNLTSLPSGNSSQEDAEQILSLTFQLVIPLGCPAGFFQFMCLQSMPPCESTGIPTIPCKELCETGIKVCYEMLEASGVPIPPLDLDCSLFPPEETGLCFAEDPSGLPYEDTETDCEQITIPLCQDLPYNLTRLPNLLGHEDQLHAGLEVQQFYLVVQVECSPYFKEFLCSFYTPQCYVEKPDPPCKELCLAAKEGCIEVLTTFGFSWPESLDCDQFPSVTLGTSCYAGQVTTSSTYPGQDYREDYRCGGDYLAPNGEVAKCKKDGQYPCCSPEKWCGISSDHCDCSECIDYRYHD